MSYTLIVKLSSFTNSLAVSDFIKNIKKKYPNDLGKYGELRSTSFVTFVAMQHYLL